MVPEGWRQVPLTELVTFKSGGTPSTQNPDYWGGEIPWISAKDFTSLRLSDSQLKVTMLGAQSGTRLVPAGTVLLLVRGMTLHKDVPIGLTTQPMTFNQDVRALLPKNGVSPEFLAYSLVASKQRLRQFVDTAGHRKDALQVTSCKSYPSSCRPRMNNPALRDASPPGTRPSCRRRS
jgi:type I restriction enzyme S subunit